MALVVFGLALTALGLLTALGGLRTSTQWPILFPFGWFIFFGIPAGLGIAFVGVYGLAHAPLIGWAGLVLIVVSVLGFFLTPRPFDPLWAKGLRSSKDRWRAP